MFKFINDSANGDFGIVDAVEFVPLPAITGTRPLAVSFEKRIRDAYSTSVNVELSPVVAHTISADVPLLI